MGIGVKRAVAAVGTVVVAAAVNVTTGMLTQHWALAWWAATAAVLVIGGGLQAWLMVKDTPDRVSQVAAKGHGSIAAAGSVRHASTKVAWPSSSGSPGRRGLDAGGGITASGLGAIASGGDIEDARTEVMKEGPVLP